jgi:hypothetical protein
VATNENRRAVGDAAARQLANTTKTAPPTQRHHSSLARSVALLGSGGIRNLPSQ